MKKLILILICLQFSGSLVADQGSLVNLLGKKESDVRALLANPLISITIEDEFLRAGEGADRILEYEGLKIFLEADRVETLLIESALYKIEGMPHVGESLDKRYSKQIINSDCYINFNVELEKVSSIRIFCSD